MSTNIKAVVIKIVCLFILKCYEDANVKKKQKQNNKTKQKQKAGAWTHRYNILCCV